MANEVKFQQIVIAPWDGNDGRRTYSMFALGDDGRVYRQERSAGGWRPMAGRIFTPTQVKEIDKKKYGSKYQEREDSDE